MSSLTLVDTVRRVFIFSMNEIKIPVSYELLADEFNIEIDLQMLRDKTYLKNVEKQIPGDFLDLIFDLAALLKSDSTKWDSSLHAITSANYQTLKKSPDIFLESINLLVS